MIPRSGLFIALVLLAPLGLPGVVADATPDTPPPPEHLPVPFPTTPQDEAITVDLLQEYLRQLVPGSVPMNGNCVMSEEAPYDDEEDPGEPVTYEVDEEKIVVRVWHEGTVYTFKVKQECITYRP